MNEDTPILKITICSIVALVLAIILIVGGAAGCKSYDRYQKRADATNNQKVARTTTKTRIFVAKQEAIRVAARDGVVKALADQRVIEAQGIRKSQDLIAATLTPLYVQHEAIKSQLSSPATKIYIPVGPQGIPLVNNVAPTGGK